jgi:hypothetical protein
MFQFDVLRISHCFKLCERYYLGSGSPSESYQDDAISCFGILICCGDFDIKSRLLPKMRRRIEVELIILGTVRVFRHPEIVACMECFECARNKMIIRFKVRVLETVPRHNVPKSRFPNGSMERKVQTPSEATVSQIARMARRSSTALSSPRTSKPPFQSRRMAERPLLSSPCLRQPPALDFSFFSELSSPHASRASLSSGFLVVCALASRVGISRSSTAPLPGSRAS